MCVLEYILQIMCCFQEKYRVLLFDQQNCKHCGLFV